MDVYIVGGRPRDGQGNKRATFFFLTSPKPSPFNTYKCHRPSGRCRFLTEGKRKRVVVSSFFCGRSSSSFYLVVYILQYVLDCRVVLPTTHIRSCETGLEMTGQSRSTSMMFRGWHHPLLDGGSLGKFPPALSLSLSFGRTNRVRSSRPDWIDKLAGNQGGGQTSSFFFPSSLRSLGSNPKLELALSFFCRTDCWLAISSKRRFCPWNKKPSSPLLLKRKKKRITSLTFSQFLFNLFFPRFQSREGTKFHWFRPHNNHRRNQKVYFISLSFFLSFFPLVCSIFTRAINKTWRD